jgi:hypothetical protein
LRILSRTVFFVLVWVLSFQNAWAVGGTSFAGCIANGLELYSVPTSTGLSAAAPIVSSLISGGSVAVTADLAAAYAATAACVAATLGIGTAACVPAGIAASIIASSASFPGIYGAAESALAPIALEPGGVGTGAFGGMGIDEPLSGPGYWLPIAGGIVFNLEDDLLAIHSEICAQSTNVITAWSALASEIHSDFSNMAKLRDASETHRFLLRKRLEGERRFEPEPNLCQRAVEFQQAGPTIETVHETQSLIESTIVASSSGISNQSMTSSMASWPEPDESSLFGSGTLTLSALQMSDGIRTIYLLTHPPTHRAGDGESASTPAGGMTEATLLARESLIRHVLVGLYALHYPTTSGGPSLMQELSAKVQDRFGNPSWLVGLHAMHPTTIRREIATEKSLLSEIRYLNMISRQNRESLSALIASESSL